MKRSSSSIKLVLIGTALFAAGCRESPEGQYLPAEMTTGTATQTSGTATQRSYHRSAPWYYFWMWGRSGYGSGSSGWTSGHSSLTGGSGSSGSSSRSGSVSHGGFGSTGHSMGIGS